MIEAEARALALEIAPAAIATIERFAAMLREENARQNLVAPSTIASIWSRHLLDSLQLIRFTRPGDRSWLDLGSGAGLPGIVLASVGCWRVTMVEPRRRRAAFLSQVIADLSLGNAVVIAADVRAVAMRHDLVSARAVASVASIFAWTRGCADLATRYVLPKGRSAHIDLDEARQGWQGSFHVEHSLTDPASGIVIADRVSPR